MHVFIKEFPAILNADATGIVKKLGEDGAVGHILRSVLLPLSSFVALMM